MSKAVEQEPSCLGQLKKDCSGCGWYQECLEKTTGVEIKSSLRG